MDLDRRIFENSDILGATGLSGVTLQTWANRGILALSEKQRNPGTGQKRLYSMLDIMRIATTKALIDRGLAPNAAGQIAYKVERNPRTRDDWRRAAEQEAQHVHLFVADGSDVQKIYVGNDASEVARILVLLNDPIGTGFLGAAPEAPQRQSKVAVFDIGPEFYNAVHALKAELRYTLQFRATGAAGVKVEGMPTFAHGKGWRTEFTTVGNFLTALTNALGLPAPELETIRKSLMSSEVPISLGGPSGLSDLSFPEEKLVELGMIEGRA